MAEAASDGPNRIMVFLRIRPARKGEIVESEGQKYFFEVEPNHKTTRLVDIGKQYEFDWVFEGPDVQQEELYTRIAVPVLDNVFKGFWGTMMVYGQTGTGKSFTMCNFDPRQEGIIPRTMRGIFQRVRKEPDRVYTICFSFIQIYLDRLQDLFNPGDAEELKITRDAQGVAFPGITEHVVNDEEHFRTLYENGNQYRVITATKMNPESSRGHAALFVQIKSVPRDDPSGEVRNGRLFLIDLAGYERFAKTGVQEGKQMQEARTINASLLSLGNVVQALSEKSEHIPWRNAKLTRMLEDAIGGRAKCSIILTAGPSSEHQHETLGTLYFGSRAMAVKTNAKLAVNIDYQKLAKKLQDMLSQAESKISNLEAEATRRQLEREELEARFQSEWANVKKRQEEQLQKLLDEGATPDKIQAVINANRMENELLEEQHYVQRTVMQEEQEEEVKQQMLRTQQTAEEDEEKVRSGASMDIGKLRRELQYEREEKEKWKSKAKEAETEARRLAVELNEEKVKNLSNIGDLGGSASGPGSPKSGGGGGVITSGDMRREMERRIETVKEMLEEQHMLKLQEVEEPLRDELERFKKMYTDLKAGFDDQVMAQKDALTQMYEEELATTRKHSIDVQEKLKKNHMTIKKSYQMQKEQLQEENEQLLRQVADLTARIEAGGGAAAAPSGDSKRVGVPSLADVMIMKKTAEKKAEELQQKLQDMQADLDYAQTEKQGLQKQLEEYEPKPGEERIKPAAVRKIKEDFEKMASEKRNLETELFKLKAAQALSGPQKVAGGATDEDGEFDPLDSKDDIAGDFEGMVVFTQKLLKFPYFAGAQKVPHTHEHVLTSLTTDLDDYRRAMRSRVIFIGDANCGKTSTIKCFIANGPSLMRSAPEVTPTVHPSIHTGSVDDNSTPRGDLYKLYVKFEDVEERAQQQQGGGLFGGMASLVGLGASGVADPAKVYVDIIDTPGAAGFWRGAPSMLLPGKNVIYCVTYKLTNGIDAIKEELSRHLTNIHASASRAYPKNVGGDAPRVGICLLGTHRDGLRDSKDAAVHALLNKITLSLGEVFFRLRGEESTGLVIVGNFALSCRDWTVTSAKGARGPQTMKDLFSWITLLSSQLYPLRPSGLLPSTRDSVAHTTYMLENEKIEGPQERTSQLDGASKRLHKGIVTLVSLLYRECKVRWLMDDKELRTVVGEHLGVDDSTSVGMNAISFVIRELLVRGIVGALPGQVYEPKYLPKPKEDYSPDEAPLPRDGAIMLDPISRFILIYSAFIAPKTLEAIPASNPVLKDKAHTLFDVAALQKQEQAYRAGFLNQEFGQIALSRFLGFTSQDLRLMFEFLCVMGLGVGLKQELAMLAPCHFTNLMPNTLVDYVSFLLSCQGDGIGRKYTLNAVPPAFFSRLQLKLVPFSHAPAKDAAFTNMNWADGSYLVFDKTRLKWGLFCSRGLKDAVMQTNAPVRGIMRVEGNQVYIAITARCAAPAATNLVKPILNAIHHEISVLCKREFRGVSASYQEMTIGGCDMKRGSRLQQGIQTILGRGGASVDEIRIQQGIVGTFQDPKGQEIDNAIAALPDFLLNESA